MGLEVLCANVNLGDLHGCMAQFCRSLRFWNTLGLTLGPREPPRLWSCIPSRPRAHKSRPPPSSAQPTREARRAHWTGATGPLNRACPTPAPSLPRHIFSGISVESLRFEVWVAFMAVMVCSREIPCSLSRRSACQVLCAVGALAGGPLCMSGEGNVDNWCAGRAHSQIGTVGAQAVPGQVMVRPPEAR
jgi:hypothetical protein